MLPRCILIPHLQHSRSCDIWQVTAQLVESLFPILTSSINLYALDLFGETLLASLSFVEQRLGGLMIIHVLARTWTDSM